MEGMNIVLAGGSGGLGAAVATMAAERGAAGIGIIDVNVTATLGVLKQCADHGAKTAMSISDISTISRSGRARDRLAAMRLNPAVAPLPAKKLQ